MNAKRIITIAWKALLFTVLFLPALLVFNENIDALRFNFIGLCYCLLMGTFGTFTKAGKRFFVYLLKDFPNTDINGKEIE